MNKKFNLANTVTMNSAVLPHFKKTDSIMYLPMMKNVREKMRRLNLFDSSENLFEAFTLAETLITLTILGVVAAITVPSLINRQMEAATRTKVKKAMTVYEKALNNMIMENDLKTNQAIIDFGAEGGACKNTTTYFKKVEGDGCRFKTADRIWWDITDIENPLIILRDEKKDEEIATLQELAKDTNDMTTYAFVGKIDDTKSIIRINDTSYKPGANDEAYLTKLYGFVNPNKAADDGGGGETPKSFLDDCEKVSDDKYTCDGMPIKKVPNVSGQCVNISSGSLAGTQSCADDGDYWISESYIPDTVYSGGNPGSEENCQTSTFEYCSMVGDYYNAAKNYCKSKGMHLSTLGELKSLGYTDGVFLSSDEYNSSNAYTLSYGYSGNTSKTSSLSIICVGN